MVPQLWDRIHSAQLSGSGWRYHKGLRDPTQLTLAPIPKEAWGKGRLGKSPSPLPEISSGKGWGHVCLLSNSKSGTGAKTEE